MSSPLPDGTKLGRYVIRSVIGTGGMGEVYLADDTLLRRPAALKLLIGNYTEKEERLHRFEREAYAASSLNHPNIVTIYEIGADGGHHFIATEYVDGDSLRQRARISHLGPREIVEIAIQVASALTAAHEAGIIHRDIKPENIMLRRDGYVKVLDFGLAKLTDESWSDAEAEAATQLMIKTEPGRVMGTIDYMSPEQARGRDVDQRSDIFSLGVVLYELTARAKPFTGDTKSDVLAAVLTAEALPLAQRCPGVPAELNRIVNKCLKKDREERYQSTKELLVDLKSLRQELEFASKMGLTGATSELTSTSSSTPASTQPSELHPTTISELFIKEVRTHPRRSFFLFAMVVVVMLAASLGLYRLIKLAGKTDSFQNMRLAKLTSSGDLSAIVVAISSDGKYLVYAVSDTEQESLWVQHVATSSRSQIVVPAEVHFTGATFSPDGSYVYYTIEDPRGRTTLFQVPVLGGPPRRLVDDAAGPISFSKDGSRFVFRRNAGTSQLMLANADGTGVQSLAVRPEREIWLAPAWSPDDQVIVASALSFTDNKSRLVAVPLDGGKETLLPTDPWIQITALAWLSDGSGLVLTARDVETKLYQIWFVSYPDGKTRRITNDLNSYAGVSLTGDGKSLVSIQSSRRTNLWVAPNGEVKAATSISSESGKDEGLSGLSWTPDGRIVHTARTSGATDLWIVDKTGANKAQLTQNAGRNMYPRVTTDGRYIIFVSDRTGRNEIWRADIDGRNATQLTNVGISGSPGLSPDGNWVFYQAQVDKTSTIWKTSIDGGSTVQLTRVYSTRPLVSPNGKEFVCSYGEQIQNSKLAVISTDGGEPERILDLPEVLKSGLIQWDNKGDALIYKNSKNGIDNLFLQMLNGGPPRQLTDFKSDQIFAFDWTRDGKDLIVARGDSKSDVVMITSFR